MFAEKITLILQCQKLLKSFLLPVTPVDSLYKMVITFVCTVCNSWGCKSLKNYLVFQNKNGLSAENWNTRLVTFYDSLSFKMFMYSHLLFVLYLFFSSSILYLCVLNCPIEFVSLVY